MAAVVGDQGGFVYLSSTFGSSWTEAGHIMSYSAVSMSADGVFIAAAATADHIFVSSDAGLRWTPRASAQNWVALSISGHAKVLAAATATGEMYTSSDYGVSWVQQNITKPCSDIASSYEGTVLIAVASDDIAYISTNAGLDWYWTANNESWSAVAISYDGTKVIFSTNTSCSGCSDSDGRVYIAEITLPPSPCAADTYLSSASSLCIACPVGSTSGAGQFSCACKEGLFSFGYGDDLACSASCSEYNAAPTLSPTKKPVLSYITSPHLDETTIVFLIGVGSGAFLCVLAYIFLIFLRCVCGWSKSNQAVAAEEYFGAVSVTGNNKRNQQHHQNQHDEVLF
jgi:hypothetical protein